MDILGAWIRKRHFIFIKKGKMVQTVKGNGKYELERLPYDNNLFSNDDLAPQSSLARCKDCKHIQKTQCGGSVFFYCVVRKSSRTLNKLLKVKCKTPACGLFEKEEEAK